MHCTNPKRQRGLFGRVRFPDGLTIFAYLSDDPGDAKEREHEVSIILIESIEPLDVPASKGGN